jgi:hypothetical protein
MDQHTVKNVNNCLNTNIDHDRDKFYKNVRNFFILML